MREGNLRLGIADHLGWAIAVTAATGKVVDRRRIELIEPGLPAAPIHYVGGPYAMHRPGEQLDDGALTALVTDVRASVVRATSVALDVLQRALPDPIVSMSLRAWPDDFPDDIAVQRRAPYESRADPIMYRQVLAEQAHRRGWAIHLYDAKGIVSEAAHALGSHARDVLTDARVRLGTPWSKDHEVALAATIVATRATP